MGACNSTKTAQPSSKQHVPSKPSCPPTKKFIKLKYVSEDFEGFDGPDKDPQHPVEDVYKCVMRNTGLPRDMIEVFAEGKLVPLDGTIAAAGLKDGQTLTFTTRLPQTAQELAKVRGASAERAIKSWLQSIEGTQQAKEQIDAALLEALSAGNELVCREMIAVGAEVKPWHLHTAAAADQEAPGIVNLLVKAGLKPSSRAGLEETPLQAALGHNNHIMAEALLKAGANPNRGDDNDFGRTPLQLCAIVNDTQGIELLLKYGAEVSGKDEDGQTALHLVAGDEDAENTNVCIDLLQAGAKVDAKDNDGRTPLQLAAFAGHMDICLTLLDADADVTKKDKSGFNALHCADSGGHERLYRELCAAKAEQRASRGFFGKRKRR